MFCENCGAKNEKSYKFCIKCGEAMMQNIIHKEKPSNNQSPLISDEKWWYRLFKVVYIFFYIPLPFAVWLAWDLNYDRWDDTSIFRGLWYASITFLGYSAVMRVIKIAILYIFTGFKHVWKEEFKKLF